jgi:hypothetical protein
VLHLVLKKSEVRFSLDLFDMFRVAHKCITTRGVKLSKAEGKG